jgi:hypothetical protein
MCDQNFSDNSQQIAAAGANMYAINCLPKKNLSKTIILTLIRQICHTFAQGNEPKHRKLPIYKQTNEAIVHERDLSAGSFSAACSPNIPSANGPGN